MSDTVRGVALLLSVVLWSPVARPLLEGRTSPEQAGLLYAAALVVSLVGCALLAAVVGAYAPGEQEADGDAEQVPERRASDLPA